MRIFVTGATGFIGSALVPELAAAGHHVIGLARSGAARAALGAARAKMHPGSLEDLTSLREGAEKADAVVHLGFNHDFARFRENSEVDRRAIVALGEALAGSGRPLLVTSGIGPVPGRPRTEEDDPAPPSGSVPRASEQAAAEAADRGARVAVVRLPQVHDRTRQGLVTYAVAVAREKGVAVYAADGRNRIPAVHRLDAARLYRLVLEKGSPGSRYHAVGEEGLATRAIAEAIGRRLDVPVASLPTEDAAAHFGWLGAILSLDMPASSALTQDRMGWKPEGPDLLSDVEEAVLPGR